MLKITKYPNIQTGRNFKKLYKDHFQSYKYGSQNSKLAQHLLDSNHSFGSMHDIMTPLCFNKKGIHLNTLGKFHIFEEVQRNNYKFTVTENKIFQTILNNGTIGSLPPPPLTIFIHPPSPLRTLPHHHPRCL
jgi:hypothetical protein